MLASRKRTTASPYKLPFESAKAAALALNQAVYVEVSSRGGEFRQGSEYVSQLRQIGEWLYSQRTPGLLLSGKVGNGKTTFMDAIINLYSLGEFYHKGIRTGFRRIDASAITELYRADEAGFHALKALPMVAIDDLGLEIVEVQSWGNVTTPVIDLLSHRYTGQMLTIVTTNLPPAEIEKRYGLRIRDRFREMMERVEFNNKSYRGGAI